jgi:DNA-binding LytR/AlgR family response regulator
MNPPNILVIDADAANWELSTWFLDRPKPPKLFLAFDVSAAVDILRTEHITVLFIRIDQWDAFQCLRISVPQVIFLSGRAEKCTQHLRHLRDFHLQAPYRPSHLLKAWSRLADARFHPPILQPQPLTFFFLKVSARYMQIYYRDLHWIRGDRGKLRIQTRDGDYHVSGSLSAFTARIPIPLTTGRRGWLVNETYESEVKEKIGT